MIKLKVADIRKLFDIKDKNIKGDISPIISMVGEDLSAALFKKYYEEANPKTKVIISSEHIPKTGSRTGPRLDRWIYIHKPKHKSIAFQTEIKNWSANALGARSHGTDLAELPRIAYMSWQDRIKYLTAKDRNGENKVFYPMVSPGDMPNNFQLESLIIYWFMLSKDGKNLDPFFTVDLKNKNFKKLHVFSMSNYMRKIKDKYKELRLDMPSAERRIRLLKKFFPIAS